MLDSIDGSLLRLFTRRQIIVSNVDLFALSLQDVFAA